MGARHFTELKAWQLADDLRGFVFRLTSTGPVTRDFEMLDQMRRAADSVCDNTAEGYGRYRHRDFSNFLVIAKASLDETESQLLGGLDKGYFQPNDVALGRVKVARTRRALLNLKRHLDTTTAPVPWEAYEPKRRGQ